MAGLTTRLADEDAAPRSNESTDSDPAGGPTRHDPFLMAWDTSDIQVDHETIKEVLGGLIAVSQLA